MNSIAQFSRFSALVLLCLCIARRPGAAQTSQVVATATEAALRAAMAGGGAITFACDGIIGLSSPITNWSDTQLDATGHQITLSGNRSVRVFCVATNVHFSARNLTIAEGSSSGGSAILNLGGVVDLTGVSFRSNSANVYSSKGANDLIPRAGGGAIFNRGGAVNATNCSFVGNAAETPQGSAPTLQALVQGGAIRNEAGLVQLQSCGLSANRATGGSSTSPWQSPPQGDPASGGAIHNSGTLTLRLCSFTSNSATGGSSSGDPTGVNGAPAWGGAIRNEGTLTVEGSSFFANVCNAGAGGPGMATSNPNDANGYPGGNGGSAGGGAISSAGALWVANSTLVSNLVFGGRAGSGGSGRQTAPDYGGNGARGGDGGAAYGGALTAGSGSSVVNCTVAFNRAVGGAGGPGGSGARSVLGSWGGNGGNGGAAVGGSEGAANLTNCTVAFNLGQPGSGGWGGAGSIWQGQGGNGVAGTDGSAWGGTRGATLANALVASNAPPDANSLFNPQLGPLADNGGPTLTLALLAGSPAIGAADTALAPPTDQRGYPRPAGSADLGACEYGYPPVLQAVPRSGGGVELAAQGRFGQACRLLASPDLAHWTPVATNQFNWQGSLLFPDPGPLGQSWRFYRLAMP